MPELYPHQPAAVDHLLRQPHVCLADGPGLGKTISAAVALKRLLAEKPDLRVSILAPTVALYNWQRELETWAGMSSTVLPSTAAAKRIFDRERSTEPVVITSHSLTLSKPVLDLLVDVDVLIGDEAHYFRRMTAKRTKGLYQTLEPTAERVWLLTGTPMPNEPTELWPMLHNLHGDFAEALPVCIARSCKTRPCDFSPSGYRVVGAKDMAGLRARIGSFMLYRTKEDELDLPIRRFETITVAPSKYPPGFAAMQRQLEGEKPPTPEQAFEWLREHEDLSRFRRLCGEAKVEPAIELVRSEFESGLDRIVLMAHHREVIARLAEGLADYNPVVVTGETSSEDRIEAVDAFQTGEASVYIGNITASGTAVTLTRASELLFIEASYVPGDNAQAADRIYRIGQTRPCRVRFLSLASSVDEIVVGVIRNKVAMHKELFG